MLFLIRLNQKHVFHITGNHTELKSGVQRPCWSSIKCNTIYRVPEMQNWSLSFFFSVSQTCFLDHYLTSYKTEHNYFLVLIFHTSNLSMYSTCLGHTYTVFNKVNYDYYRLTIILVLNGKHSYLFINVLSLQQFWQICKASKDNFVH